MHIVGKTDHLIINAVPNGTMNNCIETESARIVRIGLFKAWKKELDFRTDIFI